MFGPIREELKSLVANAISGLWGVEHDPVVEVPKQRSLGDFALPAALHLARELKRGPRQLATELQAAIELPTAISRVDVAGPGYLNFYLRRSEIAARVLSSDLRDPSLAVGGKTVVEHTNINPNKAAHIGHLRNAVLGDVLVRSLRWQSGEVETQNYIDDTGVQVADVVVGFVDIEGKTTAAVAEIPEPFDYYCWDLYSRVGAWYEEDEDRRALRRETLHALEAGRGERAEIGRIVARRVLRRHLETMARLDIGYDLLTHESDILGLDFFSNALEALKASGAVRLESEGKNAGCWVMPLSESSEFAGLEDPDKVIVRSDGTVTYVGKDIAYQLWKFGLLGRDFHYELWPEVGLWKTTSAAGESDHPSFGGADRVINVIDIRQSYLQKVVRAGLESLGHEEQAERSIHFAYEMVALSASTAAALGYGSEGGALEMSGRKGIGVKADDLIDQLIAKSREEIAARNRELDEGDLDDLARQIATAALRFFMVKAGTNRVIAFDFDEALSFEGESGPYLQYALVRIRNIQRKLREADLTDTISPSELRVLPEEAWTDELWDLVVATARVAEVVSRATETLELSSMARHALDLAQGFNAIYHKYPILHAADETQRQRALAAALIAARGLETLGELLGIPRPERM